MSEIRNVTDATFEQEVIKSNLPTIVDFWATWCGPCKQVAPEMDKLASKYDGIVNVVKVDADTNPGLVRAFGIMSIPTIAFFQADKQPMGITGFRTAEQMAQQFGLDQIRVS